MKRVRPWEPRPEDWRWLHDAVATTVEAALTILGLLAPAIAVAALWRCMSLG